MEKEGFKKRELERHKNQIDGKHKISTRRFRKLLNFMSSWNQIASTSKPYCLLFIST